jgi:hypothetical protein
MNVNYAYINFSEIITINFIVNYNCYVHFNSEDLIRKTCASICYACSSEKYVQKFSWRT